MAASAAGNCVSEAHGSEAVEKSMKTILCGLLPTAFNLLAPESRESRAYIFMILWRVIGEVSDGSFDRAFHNFPGHGFVSEHRLSSSLHIWPMLLYSRAHRRHERRRGG